MSSRCGTWPSGPGTAGRDEVLQVDKLILNTQDLTGREVGLSGHSSRYMLLIRGSQPHTCFHLVVMALKVTRLPLTVCLPVCFCWAVSGLQRIYSLTGSGGYELRIDMADFDNATAFAHYAEFSVGRDSVNPEEDGYPLTVDQYSGTAGKNTSTPAVTRLCATQHLTVL